MSNNLKMSVVGCNMPTGATQRKKNPGNTESANIQSPENTLVLSLEEAVKLALFPSCLMVIAGKAETYKLHDVPKPIWPGELAAIGEAGGCYICIRAEQVKAYIEGYAKARFEERYADSLFCSKGLHEAERSYVLRSLEKQARACNKAINTRIKQRATCEDCVLYLGSDHCLGGRPGAARYIGDKTSAPKVCASFQFKQQPEEKTP